MQVQIEIKVAEPPRIPYYSDPEALWTKIKNLTALFSDKKSFTLQKRSKKTLLHQRANHEDQKFKNHRKSISVS